MYTDKTFLTKRGSVTRSTIAIKVVANCLGGFRRAKALRVTDPRSVIRC